MESENGKNIKPDTKKGSLSEPKIANTKPRFRFFNSFEEMNEADIEEMAGFTPIQNFEQVTQLILNFYSEVLQKPMDKKIHFRK